MNFFGIEISDARFEAAMAVARRGLVGGTQEEFDEAMKKALGLETGDVVAPPAGVINRES
jgi:hypothetical protein